MLRITAESEAAKQQQGGVKDVRVETNFAARKFYAQRNTYLTGASRFTILWRIVTDCALGFCLFLSLVLARTISILGDLVTAEEQLAALKAKVRNSIHR